jgi:hypothetical protein
MYFEYIACEGEASCVEFFHYVFAFFLINDGKTND